ncbi:hypothetical protein SNE510_25840 [Streptomyces sp. NE5-10]|uniref:hypothetical protein n=1 Tax=Streptomyces sp. NE5-10 TaxID=2759674 RepID=UPI001904508D|nr:hypothetical protein [Streptomyces sp. NE5-10]GHJ93065.1 hypothetical protein SNE510_25840 [Streptomyces sp. NE5-10]
MTVRAAWLQSSGQTREDTRLTLAALLTPSGQSAEETPLRSRPGVLPGGLGLTGSAPMQATVGTGRAIVQGKDTAQGAYLVAVTAPETLTIEDGNAQYDRIDLIELAVVDDAYDRTGTTEAVVRLVKGQPSATPAVPPSPAGSTLPLYTIKVPKGTSAGTGGIAWATAVTPQHWPVVALGGIMPTSGYKGAYTGQYRDAAGILQRWDGTTWVSYPKAIGGIAPSGTAAGSHTGQFRDTGSGLQRWDGAAWQYTEGTSKVLFGATQWTTAQQQTLAANTWTAISMPTVEFDDAAAFNGTTTYTVPRTGWWRLNGHVTYANDSQTGMRGARITVNGSNQPRMTWLSPAGNGAVCVGGSALIRLVTGDALQLHGYHTHTASVRTLGGSGYGCTLAAEWIRS